MIEVRNMLLLRSLLAFGCLYQLPCSQQQCCCSRSLSGILQQDLMKVLNVVSIMRG